MSSKRLPVFYSWLTRDSMNWVMSSFCTTSQEKIESTKIETTLVSLTKSKINHKEDFLAAPFLLSS